MIDFLTLGWLNRQLKDLNDKPEALTLAVEMHPVATRLWVLALFIVGLLIVVGFVANIWQLIVMLFNFSASPLWLMLLKTVALPFGTASAILGWVGILV